MARRLWITADTHFGQPEALQMFGRPFGDVDAMDEAMLEEINRSVGRRDRLLHLGDFCGPHPEGRRAQRTHARRMRRRIRCERVTLVRGNHDPRDPRFEDLFDAVHDLMSWREAAGRLRVNACHWPMRLWRGQFKGAVLLHGHAHGGLAMQGRAVDVGVDAWRWRPIALQPLLTWLARIDCHAPDAWPRLQRDRDPELLPELPLPG